MAGAAAWVWVWGGGLSASPLLPAGSGRDRAETMMEPLPKGSKTWLPYSWPPKHYHCSALCPRCGAVLGKSSSSSSSPFWGRGTSGCQCCWSGCARRGSGSPCSVLSLQKQTNTRGEGTFQKHLLLVLLAYHKSKHNIFSFLGINV